MNIKAIILVLFAALAGVVSAQTILVVGAVLNGICKRMNFYDRSEWELRDSGADSKKMPELRIFQGEK